MINTNSKGIFFSLINYWIKYLHTIWVLRIKNINSYLRKSDKSYVRFIILCTARSGSTWLHTLLNSHPNIHSKGEITLIHHDQSIQDYAYTTYPLSIHAVGLKVFYDDDSYQEALNSIKKDKGIRVIHLVRNNLTEQFISYKKALTSGEWSFRTNSKSSKIKIDTYELLEYQKKQKILRNQVNIDLNNHNLIEIVYEDLIKQTNHETSKIQNFLEVGQKKLFSILKKQSTKPLRSQVENWEELVHKGCDL